jgi:hypothetical protein
VDGTCNTSPGAERESGSKNRSLSVSSYLKLAK